MSLVASLLLVGAAQAAEVPAVTGIGAEVAAPRPRRGETWDAWGEARLRADGWTDPPHDLRPPVGAVPYVVPPPFGWAEGGQRWWASSRLIVGTDWRPSDRVDVVMEVEALNGRFAQDPTPTGTVYADDGFRVRRADARDLRILLPRKLLARFVGPEVGALTVGAQGFSWGTGILANDGAGDPAFGDPNQGNVVLRLLGATQPWSRGGGAQPVRALALFAAVDLVLRDDAAFLYAGDVAVQGVLGLRTRSTWLDAGVLGTARFQRDRRDPNHPGEARTEVLVFPVDAYARVRLLPPSGATHVAVEAEGVHLAGRTDRAYGELTADGSRIAAFGVLGRVRLDHDPSRFTATVEGGLASGDRDVRDDVVRSFSFHSDHNVGLVLFDHVLPLVTAQSADLTADPALTATPPAGARHTINQGAVSNAVYVFPVVRWRPHPWVELRGGYVGAWAATDVVDVYQTGLNGGWPVGLGGVPVDGAGGRGSRSYGHEGDLAVRVDVPLRHGLGLHVGAEGGVLAPGDAFAGGRLPLVALGRGRATLTW